MAARASCGRCFLRYVFFHFGNSVFNFSVAKFSLQTQNCKLGKSSKLTLVECLQKAYDTLGNSLCLSRIIVSRLYRCGYTHKNLIFLGPAIGCTLTSTVERSDTNALKTVTVQGGPATPAVSKTPALSSRAHTTLNKVIADLLKSFDFSGPQRLFKQSHALYYDGMALDESIAFTESVTEMFVKFIILCLLSSSDQVPSLVIHQFWGCFVKCPSTYVALCDLLTKCVIKLHGKGFSPTNVLTTYNSFEFTDINNIESRAFRHECTTNAYIQLFSLPPVEDLWPCLKRKNAELVHVHLTYKDIVYPLLVPSSSNFSHIIKKLAAVADSVFPSSACKLELVYLINSNEDGLISIDPDDDTLCKIKENILRIQPSSSVSYVSVICEDLAYCGANTEAV